MADSNRISILLCNVNPLVDGESSIRSSSAGSRITGTRRLSSMYRSQSWFSFQHCIGIRGVLMEGPSVASVLSGNNITPSTILPPIPQPWKSRTRRCCISNHSKIYSRWRYRPVKMRLILFSRLASLTYRYYENAPKGKAQQKRQCPSPRSLGYSEQR